MRHKFVTILVLAMVLLLAACGGGGGGGHDDPPGGGTTGDTMSYSIDGGGTVTWDEREDRASASGFDPSVDSATSAGMTMIYSFADYSAAIGAFNEMVILYVAGDTAGDYTVGVDCIVQCQNGSEVYTANGPGTSGSISITRFDADRVVGTFNANMLGGATGNDPMQISGSFDLEPGVSTPTTP